MTKTTLDVESLTGRELPELRELWRRTFRSAPPAHAKRVLLVRLLAYGLQERAFGSLPAAARKQLDAFADRPARVASKSRAPHQAPPLAPRTRLMRDWGGRSHEVTVCEAGFSYDGTSYRSLTQIARVITGAHWSGPRFFGVASGPGAAGRHD